MLVTRLMRRRTVDVRVRNNPFSSRQCLGGCSQLLKNLIDVGRFYERLDPLRVRILSKISILYHDSSQLVIATDFESSTKRLPDTVLHL